MKLEMTTHMRLEQKMKLAPHMIQSMEILQLPILALQERIEQELNSNPVLEVAEPSDQDSEQQQTEADSAENYAVVDQPQEKPDDFTRLENLDDSYNDYVNQTTTFSRYIRTGEVDKKLEAIKNTAAQPQSLHEHLSEQWALVDADDAVKKAGQTIIDYIDDRGYLSVRLEQLHNKDRTDFSYDDLKKALQFVQRLDPPGVGARDLKDCLLIQMMQNDKDMGFEILLISEHMEKLLDNRLPQIAKAMKCSLEDVNTAIEHMSKLEFSPGLRIGPELNHPIRVDVIVEPVENSSDYFVRLVDSGLPSLRINDSYVKMTQGSQVSEKTKQFLQNNIRSARWIIDAIEQRKNTLLKVARAVVKHQRDFFEKGQLYLHPLPMSKIADEVGVHLATVSRAVAGKYLVCSQGIVPLRRFFSGGMEDENGNGLSWEAIRAKLQQIINAEDKTKPLSDDKIREKLTEAGIKGLARRTVAKYRKLLNIPAARFRKKY